MSNPKISLYLAHIADGVVDCLRNIGNVLLAHCPRIVRLKTLFHITDGIYSGSLTSADRDTSRLEHVHMVLLLQGVDLAWGQTGV